MDVFNFCWLTLLDESKKCSVFFDKNTCNVKNDIDENFNKPVNRIAYLYKFGSFNISFFHHCFEEFFTKAPNAKQLIDDFRSLKNPTICSMSVGPGTDIIGFLYSLYQINKPLINSTTFKVIFKHGSWRNLVNAMMSSSIISVPDASSCKLLESDFLKKLCKQAKGYLKEADILLMCNSFSSSGGTGKMICNTLERIHQLKPGALVFFITSEEKSAYLNKLDSFGSFVYGPVEVTLDKMPYNEKIAELVGVKPLTSGKSLFAVWQKKHKINSGINLQKEKECSLTVIDNQHSSANLTNSKSGVKIIKTQITNIPSLKRELSNDTNISSSDSLASSPQFSSSSISSQIVNTRKKEVISGDPPSAKGQKIDIFETDLNFSKIISSASDKATDSSFRKQNATQCGGAPLKKENNGNNMDFLLKNLESLVTKFEELVASRDSLQDSHVKEKHYLSDQQCHYNMHQGLCRCSIKSCQFKVNCSTCCCHSKMCNDDSNIYSSASVTNNLLGVSPQSGPCIVVPLQNLSDESLSHILSVASQNGSAACK